MGTGGPDRRAGMDGGFIGSVFVSSSLSGNQSGLFADVCVLVMFSFHLFLPVPYT